MAIGCGKCKNCLTESYNLCHNRYEIDDENILVAGTGIIGILVTQVAQLNRSSGVKRLF